MKQRRRTCVITRRLKESAERCICGALTAFGCSSGNGQTADGSAGSAGAGGPSDAATNNDGGVAFTPFTTPADPGPGEDPLRRLRRGPGADRLWVPARSRRTHPRSSTAGRCSSRASWSRFDKITLSSNPDVDPGNQALTGPVPGSLAGGLSPRLDGPWAVDLAHNGPENLAGKGDPASGGSRSPRSPIRTRTATGRSPPTARGTRSASTSSRRQRAP